RRAAALRQRRVAEAPPSRLETGVSPGDFSARRGILGDCETVAFANTNDLGERRFACLAAGNYTVRFEPAQHTVTPTRPSTRLTTRHRGTPRRSPRRWREPSCRHRGKDQARAILYRAMSLPQARSASGLL